MKSDRLVDIILPLAIADVYTYLIPDAMPYPQIGMRVLVPLGKKHIIGIVYRKHEGEIPENGNAGAYDGRAFAHEIQSPLAVRIRHFLRRRE